MENLAQHLGPPVVLVAAQCPRGPPSALTTPGSAPLSQHLSSYLPEYRLLGAQSQPGESDSPLLSSLNSKFALF